MFSTLPQLVLLGKCNAVCSGSISCKHPSGCCDPPSIANVVTIQWKHHMILFLDAHRPSRPSRPSRPCVPLSYPLVQQVLVNDQSTRNCAWGDTATCTAEIQGKMAGWPRFTAVSPLGQGHDHSSNVTTSAETGGRGGGGNRPYLRESEACAGFPASGAGVCGKGEGGSSSSYNHQGAEPGQIPVEYRLHEFGLLSPLQGFAHWPGFSLNPALWDLARLDGSYRRRYGRELRFDPADIRLCTKVCRTWTL